MTVMAAVTLRLETLVTTAEWAMAENPRQPKPGGGTRLPRLLLVKPDRTGDEILDGLLSHG